MISIDSFFLFMGTGQQGQFQGPVSPFGTGSCRWPILLTANVPVPHPRLNPLPTSRPQTLRVATPGVNREGASSAPSSGERCKAPRKDASVRFYPGREGGSGTENPVCHKLLDGNNEENPPLAVSPWQDVCKVQSLRATVITTDVPTAGQHGDHEEGR